jgi:hypothetical protein
VPAVAHDLIQLDRPVVSSRQSVIPGGPIVMTPTALLVESDATATNKSFF